MKRPSSFLFAAAAFAAGLAAVPALATTPDAAPGTAAAANEKPVASVKRYCIIDTPTGTRIERKTCQTREAWMSEGFDPLAKK